MSSTREIYEALYGAPCPSGQENFWRRQFTMLGVDSAETTAYLRAMEQESQQEQYEEEEIDIQENEEAEDGSRK